MYFTLSEHDLGVNEPWTCIILAHRPHICISGHMGQNYTYIIYYTGGREGGREGAWTPLTTRKKISCKIKIKTYISTDERTVKISIWQHPKLQEVRMKIKETQRRQNKIISKYLFLYHSCSQSKTVITDKDILLAWLINTSKDE